MGACHSKRIAPEGILPEGIPNRIPKRTLPYNINNRVLTIPVRYHTISYEKFK
jgi:hypothetical protein